MWTIDVNKWHLVACELHRIYNIVYNIKVFGVILATFAICLITFRLYRYLEL
jgi:tellurite resistance protein TehA-like permease